MEFLYSIIQLRRETPIFQKKEPRYRYHSCTSTSRQQVGLIDFYSISNIVNDNHIFIYMCVFKFTFKNHFVFVMEAHPFFDGVYFFVYRFSHKSEKENKGI